MVCGALALVGGRASAQTEAAAASASATPQPAAQLLASAQEQARKEHKNVLVMFHASWCGWCKRLEAVMDRPEYKKLFADNYVIVLARRQRERPEENAGKSRRRQGDERPGRRKKRPAVLRLSGRKGQKAGRQQCDARRERRIIQHRLSRLRRRRSPRSTLCSSRPRPK